MLAHVPSFGRNPRGSPDFLAYPVPKACMHVLGTRVPRRLGVARSASSPKAAQALGCRLTPGLRISFGRVTCMARAASVPGLWALGFLLLACVCGWVRVAVGRGFCLPLPVVAGVLGGCVWARFVVLSLFCRLFVVFVVGLWCGPAFGTCVVSCAFPLPPAVSGSGVRCGRPGLGCAPPFLAGLSGCVFCAFLFFFFFSGCWVSLSRALWSLPRLLSFGGCWLFFFFFLFFSACFGVPFFRWAAVAGLVLPVLAGWSPCACLGVLSSVPSGWGVWPPSVLLVGGSVAVGCSRAPAPPPLFFFLFFFFFSGEGACRAVPPVAFPRLAVALWLVCGVVGPSPLLAEVPVCYSPPLLAGFRCRWLWAVPATPGWGLPAAVVSGVWRWCVGGVVAGVWCGWSLATPGGGSCVLLPATPGWVSLPVVLGGPRHSWLGSVGGVAVWCVVCGVWRWCVGGVVAGVWCGWSLATPGGGSCVLLPATPGWVSLPVVVGGPRHSWLGSACGGGVWCVVCGVWRWCVGGFVAGVWCGWSLATPGGGSCVLLPATPGWVSLPVVVGGPRHSWLGSVGGVAVWCVVCGGGVLVGLWLVCGVVGPSPLLAEVPVCYSPPLLAGFRCRWWWAVPATPGWGPLAAVVCGVWCVVCGGGVLVGLWLVCGVVGPSPLLAEVPVCYSPPLLAGFRCPWWWAVPATPGWGPLAALLCGVWCVALVCWWGCGWRVVWLVPRHSWRRFLCATPRHSWLGLAAGGGGRSPPLLAGVRLRRWCVVCGVWCVAVVCWWGCGWCVVWLVPRHSWRRFLCATPRHSWLGFAAAGGGRSPPLLAGVLWRRWCVVCCWGPSPLLAEVPVCYSRHSWLGFAAAGGGRSPPLLAGVRWRRWCACFAWPGRAGRPPGRVVVRLTFSFGRFVFLLCLAPSGLGLPPSPSLLLPFLVGWGLWCVGWLLLGTCSCAVVLCVLCALSGFVAPGGRRCLAPVRVPWLWPAACLSGVPRGPAWCAAPRPVRSLSVLRSAFPTPRCLSPPRELAPPALLGGCAGHAEAGREPGSLCLPLAPAEAGALGSPRRTRSGPRDGVVPGGSLRRRSWAACAAVVGVCGPGH